MLLVLFSCKDHDNVKPKTALELELEKLPPPTQNGSQTFGAIVNGSAWKSDFVTDTYGILQEGYLTIAGQSANQPFFTGMHMTIQEIGNPLVLKSYPLFDNEFTYVSVVAGTDERTCSYTQDNIKSGTITLTRLDREARIVSGTFDLSMGFPDCDSLIITNGRFDLKYFSN
jgi:hypothetical protein